jgi:hypothetical protein
MLHGGPYMVLPGNEIGIEKNDVDSISPGNLSNPIEKCLCCPRGKNRLKDGIFLHRRHLK